MKAHTFAIFICDIMCWLILTAALFIPEAEEKVESWPHCVALTI